MTMNPPPPPSAPPTGDSARLTPPSDVKMDNDAAAASEQSENASQTAADFIRDQMQLEADAREAMPYRIEKCTHDLGQLRQNIFSCLTCNPPPKDPTAPYDAAGVCYSCSIQCHGDHNLVEIFAKRSFTCDCGTTKISSKNPCILRIDPKTKTKGVHSQVPSKEGERNQYNQNFRNRFCSCQCDYDPFKQKGTMFQCLGVGSHLEGGCGEDWYHPGCLLGLGEDWETTLKSNNNGSGEGEGPRPAGQTTTDDEEDDAPLPPGFPSEDSFDGFICYRCIEANPWLKRYAGAPGFLPPVYLKADSGPSDSAVLVEARVTETTTPVASSLKRKAEDVELEDVPAESNDAKRPKMEEPESGSNNTAESEDLTNCKLSKLPTAPSSQFSLFFSEGFRSELCKCKSCWAHIALYPQLQDEESVYEPSVSEDSVVGASTLGSGSLYERGESALKNMDRVRAIEGVMAYNLMKEQLKPFFEKFAGTGKAISADDIKDYFAKLRGDDQAIKNASQAAEDSRTGNGSDSRREQDGY